MLKMLGVMFVSVLFSPVVYPVTGDAQERQADVVLLLHGLGRTSRSMRSLERSLSEQGYHVVNVDYPSTRTGIDGLVTHLRGEISRCCSDVTTKLHFVTHSLGGILVRAYLKQFPLTRVGRVVMLSPLNQGSEVVDYLRSAWLFRVVLGPAGQQLGTDPASVPNSLGPANFELGIITGNHGLNPLGAALIPGPHDGTVSVARARVEGMRDFLVVPYGHTFIMTRKVVLEQVVHFLRAGHFKR
jgi:triacylglycerol lipase